MQWLAPWAWLGLGALAVPVLVHLFSRRPARREAFPSLRFLAASPLAPTRRTRVSDWPLLLLRMLVLALAVAALAQPLRSSALAGATAAGVTIEVRDVAINARDRTQTADAARANVGRVVERQAGPSVDTIYTADLTAGIARAVARVRLQRAPRTVRVRSSFAAGTLDTVFLASLPRDVTLVLMSVRDRAASVPPRDTIVWRTALPERDAAAVIDAVALLDGSPVRLVRGDDAALASITVATRPMAGSVGGVAGDALTTWSSAIALGVSRDDAVRASFSDGVPLDSTGVGLALVHTAGGQSTIVAHERGTAARPQLVLQSRLPETPARALALLLASSPGRPQATARSADAFVDAATLARWERLPEGPAIGGGDVPLDVHTVPTDARWLWLAALIALGAEWRLRRRPPRARADDRTAAAGEPP